MDLQDTYDEFRANVRRLAEKKIKPHAAVVDEEAAFPTASIAAFKAMGLNGLPFPEELGAAMVTCSHKSSPSRKSQGSAAHPRWCCSFPGRH